MPRPPRSAARRSGSGSITAPKLADGREVTPELFESMLEDEMEKVRAGDRPDDLRSGRFEDAVELFKEMSLALEIEEFLTIPAYRLIA